MIERARRTFGAARAFPIRERYLLGPTDPLKGWSQATFRDLEVEPVLRDSAGRPDSLALLRLPPRIREASAFPFGPGGRLGPARKLTMVL
jgi:hypothetical protein